MKVIGITGGVGCGKSSVIKIMIESYHAYHINTDQIAKEQMKKGNVSFIRVVKEFGEKILLPDGEIDRKKLAAIVFSDKDKLKTLNQLTHPPVYEEVMKIIDTKRKEHCSFILLESAILHQAGFSNLCDELWYVYAKRSLRMKRLMEDRGYTEERVKSMMKNQGTDKYYRSVASTVINNSGSLQEVKRQLELLVEKS